MVMFVIIRHGYSMFNKERRFTGQLNVPLDEIGISQAEYTCKYVVDNFKIDKIYSSDLIRAYDTVRPVAEALNKPIITRTDLREVDVGDWEGRLIEEVKKEYPKAFEFYRTNPGKSVFAGGESYAILMKRAISAIDEIARENPEKNVLISTHGGVIRALRCAWYNYPVDKIGEIPHVPNASVTVIKYEEGSVEFIQTGYNGHLPDQTTEEGIK